MSDEIEVKELNEDEIVVRHYGEPVTLSTKEAKELQEKIGKVLDTIGRRKNLRREKALTTTLNTLEDLMNADYPTVTGKAHDRFHKLWVEFFPFDKYGLFRPDGYWPVTRQMATKVMFNQNLPFEPQAEQVKRITPFLKPFKDPKDDGENLKHLGIFESTCSEFFSYDLVGQDDGKWRVRACRWSSARNLKEGTLDECLKYIYDRHPYIKLKGTEEEND